MSPIPDLMVFPEPYGFVLISRKIRIPYPDNPESGFFKSYRARYGLSIHTLDAKLSFGGNWVQPEEISGPKFYRISHIFLFDFFSKNISRAHN